MAKMRVSQHSGRVGSAAHNDRSFLRDKSAQEIREIAPHIRADAMDDNMVIGVGGRGDLRERELAYYRDRYGAGIEATNARYRAQGHSERCKTVEQVYTGAKTRPEEMILQIGDREHSVDPETFEACVHLYLEQLDRWNLIHGEHMKILDVSIHHDESTPHAHIRRVWEYTDKDGFVRLGQNKALRAAGVELPDPDKPEGRYNNRKISFDAWARTLWQEIARGQDLEIETEPRVGVRHKDKAEFVSGKLQEHIEHQTAQIEYLADKQVEAINKLAVVQKNEREASTRLREAVDATERYHDLVSREAREQPPVKRKFGGREVVEVDPETYQDLQEAAARVREADRIRLRKDEILRDAKEQAAGIIRAAESERDSIDEKLSRTTIDEIRRDFPEVDKCFANDVYQGRDWPGRQQEPPVKTRTLRR